MDAQALATKAAEWAKLAQPVDTALEDCARAVVALMATLPAGQGEWDDAAKLGAAMLTVRLHRRRNSPAGIESMSELGATYVTRYDSDIARLLRIEAFAKPVAI